MKTHKIYLRSAVALLFVLMSTCVSADVVTLNSQNQGWYDSSGFNDPTNSNYVVGNASFGGAWNNFFTFDASLLSGMTVTGATLNIFNPADGFTSYRPSETVSINSYSGSVAALTAGNGGVAAYNGLGSGTFFGSTNVSETNNNGWVQFTLNNDFLNYINSGQGVFALGGTLSTLDTTYTADQYAFAFSDNTSPLPQLVLTTSVSTVPDAFPNGLLELIVVSLLVANQVYRRMGSNAITTY